jgi:hypothetical protein
MMGHAIASGAPSISTFYFFNLLQETGLEIPVVSGYTSVIEFADPNNYPWMTRIRV